MTDGNWHERYNTSFLLTQEDLTASGFKFFLGMGEEPGAGEVRLKTLIN